MSWEEVFVIVLLVGAVISFVLEKVPTDLTSFGVLALLILASMIASSIGEHSLPSVETLLSVFSNPAPITIAAMFVVSAALERTGAIENLANLLSGFSKLGYRTFLFVMILAVAITSAFVNNTPVVVVLLPVVLSLARQMKLPASKMLIPLSYASIVGGTCTAIGTSTNILVSGVLIEHEMEPIKMFELMAIGLPLLLATALYLVLFGKHLLPMRETLTSILSEEERKEYLTEAFVRKGSDLAGKTVKEGILQAARGLRVLEVIRYGIAVPGDISAIELREEDRLVLSCRASSIMSARSIEGVSFDGEKDPEGKQGGLDLEQIAAHQGAIVEGVVAPNASVIGSSIDDINFRQRFRMIVLAIHRHGRNVREKLRSIPLEPGDTLLMMGTDEAIENLRTNQDVILLDRTHLPAHNLERLKPFALGIVGLAIFVVSLNLIPIVGATLVAVAALVGSGCIKPKDAYEAIEWRILMLIFGMLALGMAMESTGLTGVIAGGLEELAVTLPEDIRPWLVLGLLYLLTNVFTEMLSNNATAVLMAPIAIGLSLKLNYDPRPFIIAVCVASSASFSTPIGYQTNTYVYGVGGYRFSDFLKVGLPLNLLAFVVALFVIPRFWPF